MRPATRRPARRPARPQPTASRPLRGVRVLSLALNLPGPVALRRLSSLGARCLKVEPPSGDPAALLNPEAYEELHRGIPTRTLDLKSPEGLRALERLLASTDVLLTSFRPSALRKLGLDFRALRSRHPALSLVRLVGSPGAAADLPGHDLTYEAAAGLVPALATPVSLFADMAGALLACEAVLHATLAARSSGRGCEREVSLADAAHFLSAPHRWGLTMAGGLLGGGHAGYRVYPCRDGRVAVAALEPHFAAALSELAGLATRSTIELLAPEAHRAVAAFFAGRTRAELERAAAERDLPLHVMA